MSAAAATATVVVLGAIYQGTDLHSHFDALYGDGVPPRLPSSTSAATVAMTSEEKEQGKPTAAVRVVALCACLNSQNVQLCGPMDKALMRLSELTSNEISYAGIHHIMKDDHINATSTCEDMVERHLASLLPPGESNNATANSASAIIVEMIYDQSCPVLASRRRPLDVSLAGPPFVQPRRRWGAGLHVPPRRTHARRYIKNWGEVIFAKEKSCNPSDYDSITMYRSKGLTEKQRRDCAVVHYPEILGWAETILKGRVETGDSPANETVLSMLTRRRSDEDARRVLDSKTHFCVILTLTTMQPFYAVDALIRHALARLLTEKHTRPCVRLPMWKGDSGETLKEYGLPNIRTGPHDTYKMQGPFKFVIAMPNEISEGYLVEKTVHPYLAGSLAVTAVPDVGTYVNANAMVSCRIDPAEIAAVQQYYRGDLHWMPFNTTPDDWAGDPSIVPIRYIPYAKDGIKDEPVLEFVTRRWERALKPCVDEIIRLDGDDDAYAAKLTEPYLLNGGRRSLFDGTYLALSMLEWFSWAGSPLVEGLEGRMEGLEGMLEQTPGWGLP